MSFIKELLISIIIITIVAILSSQLIMVPTESMSPTINAGDVVLVQKTNVLDVFNELDPNDIKIGDIVVYEKPPEVQTGNNQSESSEKVIHRVIYVNTTNGVLVLKGDNNLLADKEGVNLSQVKGKAVIWNKNPVVIPKLGFIIFYIKHLIAMV